MHEELKLDNQVCFRIYTAQRMLSQAYRPLLDPLGLTYPQYLVMLVLWEQDNLLVGELGRKLMLDSNTLTPLLQRMENEGLIIRSCGIADGRQTLVTLTKKGLHMQDQAKEIPSCLTGCWQNEKQAAGLIASLDSMIEALKQK